MFATTNSQISTRTRRHSKMKERLAMFLLASLLAVAAAALKPADAGASRQFSDGVMMFAQINCDGTQGFNTLIFNGSQQTSWVNTQVWDHQTRRWMNTPGMNHWYPFQNAFTSLGYQAWLYGRGLFTFRIWLGRYVHGTWVVLQEYDQSCYFAP